MAAKTISAQTLTLLRGSASALKTAGNARALFVALYALPMDHKDVVEFVGTVNNYSNYAAVRKLMASASGARKLYAKENEPQWHFTSAKKQVSVCSGDPTPRGSKTAEDKPKGADKGAVALEALEALNAELQAKVEKLEAELQAAQVRTLTIAKGAKIDNKTGKVTVSPAARAVFAELIAVAG